MKAKYNDEKINKWNTDITIYTIDVKTIYMEGYE